MTISNITALLKLLNILTRGVFATTPALTTCFPPSSQADVPPVQSEVHWSGQKGQIHSLDGYSCSRRLQVQIS